MRKKGTTMQDVARAAGVSQPTVSMILNGKLSNFPASTVESVLAAASALQYNFRGTSVATGDTVLVIATQLTNPFYTAIIQAMDRYAAKRDIRVTAACTYHDPELESDYLTTAIKQHYLGVVFLYPPDNQEVYASHGARIPIVTVCDRRNRQGDIVELNNFRAGALAAEHLLGLGHTNIAVLTHSSDRSNTPRAERVAGALSKITPALGQDHLLMLTSNSSRSGYLEETAFHYHVGYSMAQNKRIYENDITGLICVNDLMAYGVMDALIAKGYRIPEDFSVIGSDNLLFSGMSRVSLTSIEHHTDVLAQSALTTLINRTRMLEDNQVASAAARFHVQCQPSLVVRESTGVARSGPLPRQGE